MVLSNGNGQLLTARYFFEDRICPKVYKAEPAEVISSRGALYSYVKYFALYSYVKFFLESP